MFIDSLWYFFRVFVTKPFLYLDFEYNFLILRMNGFFQFFKISLLDFYFALKFSHHVHAVFSRWSTLYTKRKVTLFTEFIAYLKKKWHLVIHPQNINGTILCSVALSVRCFFSQSLHKCLLHMSQCNEERWSQRWDRTTSWRLSGFMLNHLLQYEGVAPCLTHKLHAIHTYFSRQMYIIFPLDKIHVLYFQWKRWLKESNTCDWDFRS